MTGGGGGGGGDNHGFTLQIIFKTLISKLQINKERKFTVRIFHITEAYIYKTIHTRSGHKQDFFSTYFCFALASQKQKNTPHNEPKKFCAARGMTNQ